jgi:hypothetical protein
MRSHARSRPSPAAAPRAAAFADATMPTVARARKHDYMM